MTIIFRQRLKCIIQYCSTNQQNIFYSFLYIFISFIIFSFQQFGFIRSHLPHLIINQYIDNITPMKNQAFTNQVFFIQTQGRVDVTQIFIPCYVRINFKKISNIDIPQAKAKMIATMIVSFSYENIEEDLFKEIKNNLQVTVNGQVHFKLQDEQNSNIKSSQNKNKSLLSYTIREVFQLEMTNENVVWAPFDTLDLSLTITIRPIDIVGVENYIIKFNCMDTENRNIKFSETDAQNFGQFGLARQYIQVHYTNSQRKETNQKKKIQIQPEQKLRKIQAFQFARFELSIYRYPTTTLFTIFFPLWLLASINLAIFFTINDFKDRIANVATLLVAYTAFLPTIRQRIPPTPKITLIDVIVYSLLLNSLLCLVRSFMIKDYEEDIFRKQYQWNQKKDVFFIVSVFLTVIGIVAILTILLIFKLIWEPNYVKVTNKTDDAVKFESKEWGNQECDHYFSNIKDYIKTKKSKR